MSLATATPEGEPSVRIVLLKGFDERGFVFFTNHSSEKGKQLEANPQAALALYWVQLERQIRIAGDVEKTSREESDHYFHSRPHGSQLGAWVSRQSEVIDSRQILNARLAKITERYAGGEFRSRHTGAVIASNREQSNSGKAGKIVCTIAFVIRDKRRAIG